MTRTQRSATLFFGGAPERVRATSSASPSVIGPAEPPGVPSFRKRVSVHSLRSGLPTGQTPGPPAPGSRLRGTRAPRPLRLPHNPQRESRRLRSGRGTGCGRLPSRRRLRVWIAISFFLAAGWRPIAARLPWHRASRPASEGIGHGPAAVGWTARAMRRSSLPSDQPAAYLAHLRRSCIDLARQILDACRHAGALTSTCSMSSANT